MVEDVATSLSIELDMDIVTNGLPLQVFESFSHAIKSGQEDLTIMIVCFTLLSFYCCWRQDHSLSIQMVHNVITYLMPLRRSQILGYFAKRGQVFFSKNYVTSERLSTWTFLVIFHGLTMMPKVKFEAILTILQSQNLYAMISGCQMQTWGIFHQSQ